MWEIHIEDQLLNFFYAIILGGFVCFYYDVLYFLRTALKFNKILVFLTDIFFWCSLALVTFTFLLAVSNGELRLYILVGIFMGFLIIRRLFSRIFRKILKKISIFVLKIFKAISKRFYKIFDKCEIYNNKFFKKCRKIAKKVPKIVKKLLKKPYKM